MPKGKLKMSNELIKQHYKEQAEKYGTSSESTMQDEIVREKELEIISNCITYLEKNYLCATPYINIIDLGCGNGNTIDILSNSYDGTFTGIDFSKDMISLAKKRKIDSNFIEGDCRNLDIKSDSVDLVYTERCLINILNWEEQKKTIHEIHRILKYNARYLMIECFTDGHLNYNKAREECGLDNIKEAYHNKYIDKQLFLNETKKLFEIEYIEGIKSNFLSNHYFVSRVLYPLLTKRELIRNTEFVKFFSFISENIGNYSPIQAFLLKKI